MLPAVGVLVCRAWQQVRCIPTRGLGMVCYTVQELMTTSCLLFRDAAHGAEGTENASAAAPLEVSCHHVLTGVAKGNRPWNHRSY